MSNFLVGIGAAVAAGFFGGEAPAACMWCVQEYLTIPASSAA